MKKMEAFGFVPTIVDTAPGSLRVEISIHNLGWFRYCYVVGGMNAASGADIIMNAAFSTLKIVECFADF